MSRGGSHFCAVLCLAILMGGRAHGAESAGFDSSFLSVPDAAGENRAGPIQRNVLKAKGLKRRLGDIESKATEKEVQEVISGLTALLARATSTGERYKIILNRAMASNLLVRKRLLASTELKVDTIGRKHLDNCLKDINYLLSAKDAPPQLKIRAKTVLGSSYMILDRMQEARTIFEDILREAPQAENSEWMGLVIAEELFEAGQFERAIPYYEIAQRSTSGESKEFAKYKIAWCYINLGEMDKAQAIFVELVRSANERAAASDSMRDLAFLLAHKKDPTEAIPIADRLFADPKRAIEFLGYVRANLEGQNSPAMHARIVERLLQLDKSVEGRIQLLMATLRVSRKGYVSADHNNAYRRLSSYIRRVGLKPDDPLIKKNEAALELEVQFLLKTFIDTFAGRVKSPEKWTKEDLAKALFDQFDFFFTYCLNAKARPMVASVWMDIFIDVKDWPGLDRAAEKILRDPTIARNVREQALLNQVFAIEEQRKPCEKTPPAATSPAFKACTSFMNRLRARAKTLVYEHQDSKQWNRVARRYVELALQVNDRKETLAVLDLLFEREKTADAFFRLQAERYQTGDFVGVLNDPRGESLQASDPRLLEVKREAALSLAGVAKKADDFQGYQSYIHAFLALNPDKKKALVAREDLLRTFLKRGMNKELSSELIRMPAAERFLPSWVDLVQHSWAFAMSNSSFDEAVKLVESADWKSSQGQDFLFRKVIAGMAADQLPTSAELYAMAADRREYLLGLLALLNPSHALLVFEQAHAELLARKQELPTEFERATAMLALRIEGGVWKFAVSDRSTKFLPGYKGDVSDPGPLLPFERLIGNLRFPGSKISAAAFARDLQYIVQVTARIRKQLTKQIAGQPLDCQLRAVRKAADLERRVAELILNSPVPDGLTPEQLEQYSAGIREAAGGYSSQAQEYDRIGEAIVASQEKAVQDWKDRLLPYPKMKKWDWPEVFDSDALELVEQAVEDEKYLRAMVLLDYARSESVKSDADYFMIRTGILLRSTDSEAMRYHVLDELERNQQPQIIRAWKEMVGISVPPADEKTGDEKK